MQCDNGLCQPTLFIPQPAIVDFSFSSTSSIWQTLTAEIKYRQLAAVNFVYAGFIANGAVALPYMALESWAATRGGMICLMR